jgi:hypothetical protein
MKSEKLVKNLTLLNVIVSILIIVSLTILLIAYLNDLNIIMYISAIVLGISIIINLIVSKVKKLATKMLLDEISEHEKNT